MATDLEVLNNFLDNQLKPDLIHSYKNVPNGSGGLKASGNWANELESFVEETDKGFRFGMKGTHYSFYMQNGRRQNKDQSKEGIKKFVGWAGNTFLKKWVKDKGLNISPFAVAYKIATEGIEVPNYYNDGSLLSFINTDYFKEISRTLVSSKINKLSSDIIKMYRGNENI